MGKTLGIILAGGIGTRFNAGYPKQYLQILGKEVIAYSIELFQHSDALDDFYVVLDEEDFKNRRVEEKYGVKTICGGNTRNASFRNALEYIAEHNPDCEKIFVNEAARPLLTLKIMSDYISLLDEYNYVYSAATVTDSIETVTGDYVNREEYILVRSPEGYRFKDIYEHFSANSPTSFPGHALPKTMKGCRYFDYKDNYKFNLQG